MVSGLIGSLESSEITSGGGAEVDAKGTLAYHGRGLTRSRAIEDDGAKVGGENGHGGWESHILVSWKMLVQPRGSSTGSKRKNLLIGICNAKDTSDVIALPL